MLDYAARNYVELRHISMLPVSEFELICVVLYMT